MSRRAGGGGRGDAGNVPASVTGEVRPHVRARLGRLAAECVRSAERGEQAGAALALLAVLSGMGIKGGVTA